MHVYLDTIKKIDITLKLLKIDSLNKNIHKHPDALDVGMGGNLNLSTYKKSEKYKGSLVQNFTKGDLIVVENQLEDSLKSLHIHNHLSLKNVQARNITMTGDMIKLVKAARERYKIYQNEKQKNKVKADKDFKRTIITE